uniref:Cell growth regulator with EF hand domain protein 1 n=1 Tax=Bos mutus grunniens TaxID=30521 RepID=A0A8B9X819_BOSMU
MCSHSHTMIPSLEADSCKCHLSITNRKSSHRYPNRHTTNILYCHTPSQPVMHRPNSLKYCHTGYTATHNTPPYGVTSPSSTQLHTQSQSHRLTVSYLLSCHTHLGPSREWAPQLNMLLIYINFIICLSASLVVCICHARTPTYIYIHTPHTLAGCGPGSAGRGRDPAHSAGARDSARARAAAATRTATWSGHVELSGGGPGGGSRGAAAAAAHSLQRRPRRTGAAAVTGRMLPVKMRTLLLLLLPLSQAAPKDGTMRLDPEAQHLPLPNPFEPGQEQLRLLQSYLKGLERMEEEPEHMSREQVLLYLFALHDYDQSGQLDGLELLSMLTAALAPGASDSPTTNPVILVVDKVLETQDLNGDGLMTPAELVNFPGEAPRHTEPREPPEPQDVEMQPLLAKSPSRQEEHDALSPGEAAGGQAEARREFLEPVQEAGGQADAVREAPGPGGEVGGQVETGDAGERAEELLGETLGSKNSPNELEVHAIQLENSEM